MQNCPDKSDSFPPRFETDVHPEIQPEMQPAFEFPGTYKKLHTGSYQDNVWSNHQIKTTFIEAQILLHCFLQDRLENSNALSIKRWKNYYP